MPLTAKFARHVLLLHLVWPTECPATISDNRGASSSAQRGEAGRARHRTTPAWPEVYVIGAQKGGTTSLSLLLRQEKSLCFGESKEVHFFDGDEDSWKNSSAKWYLNQFDDRHCTPGRYVDATPNYLTCFPIDSPGDVVCPVHRIHSLIPRAIHPRLKFIISLREPVQRLLSWYNHKTSKTEPTQRVSFEDFVDDPSNINALEYGLYFLHIQRWRRHFPRSQIFIMGMDALIYQTHDMMQRISMFLDFNSSLTKTWANVHELPQRNTAEMKEIHWENFTHVALDQVVCRKFQSLVEYYSADATKLRNMMDSDHTKRKSPLTEPPWKPFNIPKSKLPNTLSLHGKAKCPVDGVLISGKMNIERHKKNEKNARTFQKAKAKPRG